MPANGSITVTLTMKALAPGDCAADLDVYVGESLGVTTSAIRTIVK